MLARVKGLPPGIEGVEAKGKITRSDYEAILKPLLEEAHQTKQRLRFLYRIGAEFETFTPGAAWEDFHLGLKHLRLFERCAVVTDQQWIRHACQLMAQLLPCPLRVFPENDIEEAIGWLGVPSETRHLESKLDSEKGVLVVDVKGALNREDFEYLSSQIDPWIEAHECLNGLVIHARRFPGWENLGSFFRHLEFVGDHHRKVRRVALSADGMLPEFMPSLASIFVAAEIKHFAYVEIEKATAWAAEGTCR